MWTFEITINNSTLQSAMGKVIVVNQAQALLNEYVVKVKRTIKNNSIGNYMPRKQYRTIKLKANNTYLYIIKNVFINILYSTLLKEKHLF